MIEELITKNNKGDTPMKKSLKPILSMLVTIAMLLTILPSTLLTAFANDWTGYTAISTKAQLNAVRNNLSGKYYLTNDIIFTEADFKSGGAFYNGGEGWEPIGASESAAFTGIFDGNGFAIQRLRINSAYTDDGEFFAGLFGYNKGKICDLGLIDGEISGSAVIIYYFSYCVGGIVGYNSGVIENCYNTGLVSPDISYAYIGGIAGYNVNGTIKDCYNMGYISSYESDTYIGGIAGASRFGTIINCYNTGSIVNTRRSNNVGGIAGHNDNSIIENCYNTGFISSIADYTGGITGSNEGTITNCYNTGSIFFDCYSFYYIGFQLSNPYAGGIAGRSNGEISNCYNTGMVTHNPKSYNYSESYVGGIAGENNSKITNSYYMDNIPKGVSKGEDTGTKCTPEQLKQQNTFIGFNFNDIWEFDNVEYLYPTIKGSLFTDPIIEENTVEFGGGKGTSYNPYLISTKEHLNNVRNYLESCFQMTNDIVFENSDFEEGGDFYNDGKGWQPIGKYSYVTFLGIFDGNGFKIQGIKFDSDSLENAYSGIFGNSNGKICNLGYVNNTMYPTSSFPITGGIAENNYGIIENCYNTGIITIKSDYSNYIGGIAGINYNTIVSCYNTGSISSSSEKSIIYSGGIAGRNKGEIINCYNNGTISSTTALYTTYSGGITGYNEGIITSCYNSNLISSDNTNFCAGGITGYNDGTITNSHNIGIIYSSSSLWTQIGGIAGYNNNTILNCYNSGSISAIDSDSCTGGIAGVNNKTITNCYNYGDVSSNSNIEAYSGGITGYNNESTIKNCYNAGSIVAESNNIAYAGGIAGENNDGIITNCYYLDNNSKGVDEGTDTCIQCTAEQMKLQSTFIGFNFEYVWEFSGGEYPYPTIKINASKGNTVDFKNGYGTSADPYLISTKEELNNVRYYLDSHFKMINDIIFTENDFKQGGAFYNDGEGWEPIGSDYTNKFTGKFNGNGFVIQGLSISTLYGTNFIGFFGCNSGEICNLGFVDTSMNVHAYAGVIAGYSNGIIENCYSSGWISANGAEIGGIVGENSGTINNCYNTASITAKNSYAGGIAGENGGIITNCYNSGSIIVEDEISRVGGITSFSSGKIRNCYNTGSITVNTTYNSCYIGGIAGYNMDTITSCYNIGSITLQSAPFPCVGGIAGYSSSNIITNCYYIDKILNGVGEGNGTIVKCTKDQMKLQSTFIGFDFDDVWEFCEEHPDHAYPLLSMLDHPKHITSVLVTIKPDKLI